MTSSRPKQILVVDDEPIVRKSVCLALALDGYGLAEASTAEEALSKCDTEIQVVLTDYRMPGMNGDELAKAIKRRYPSKTVIMLTGFPPDRAPEAVNRVLLKPFEADVLRQVVAQSL